MPFKHPSNLPDVYDRSAARPQTVEVLLREGQKFYAQAADLQEAFSIAARRSRRGFDRVMKDGDRQGGANAFVDLEAETVFCEAGEIYLQGDILPVAQAVLENVPMTGSVIIGVRLTKTVVTEMEDPTLRGLAPGTAGEGEPGAARWDAEIAWGFEGDGAPGTLIQVYQLLDGTIINQLPPPALSGITDQQARYDFDANGHYRVDGCQVTALGASSGAQLFSIAAGTANILGYKRIREAAFLHAEPMAPDLERISSEAHTFTGPTGGTATIEVNRAPVAAVISATVVKRFTQNVVRGATPGGSDLLDFASTYEIELIEQGGAPLAPETYTLVAGRVSWAPAGAEPINGSTYQVTGLYYAPADTVAFTDTTITVGGGVAGKAVQLTYDSKLPRIDLMCLDITGKPVYVKGVSGRAGILAPLPPSSLLKLAEVHNTWLGTPAVINNGPRNYAYDEQQRIYALMFKVVEQFDRNMSRLGVAAANGISADGIFTDTFMDDFYRDPGAPQTAAINRGVLQLPIIAVMLEAVSSPAITLPWIEEVVLAQAMRTSSQVINPYANFNAFPAGMTLIPPSVFWTEHQTEWTSPITMEFTAAPNLPPGQESFDAVAWTENRAATVLPQDAITIRLDGFGVGENLATLTFDGRDIKPAGVQTADDEGQIVLNLNIPAGVPTGRRLVRATGAAGSFAEAIFAGEGVVTVDTMRRVTLVTRAAPVPVVINNTFVNITNNVVNQITNVVAGGGGNDPLAQSFALPAHRLVVGINLWISAIGNRANGIRVQLVTLASGLPTTEVLAEAFISMATVQVGDKVEARWAMPVDLPPERMFAFVILTADAHHAVSISKLGDVFGAGDDQQRVGAQPYTVGDMFRSSNRISWEVVPGADIAFEIVAAKFTATARTEDIWSGPLNQISDLLVRGVVELPTQDATMRYELVRADGSILKLAPGQGHEFSSFVTETVTLRAVLAGTAEISPLVYPNTLIAGGRLQEEARYVTRAFEFGNDVEMTALFKAHLPGASSASVAVDKADNTFLPMTLATTGILGNGWVEPKYKRAGLVAAEGRLEITLSGTPAARPSIAALRAYPV